MRCMMPATNINAVDLRSIFGHLSQIGYCHALHRPLKSQRQADGTGQSRPAISPFLPRQVECIALRNKPEIRRETLQGECRVQDDPDELMVFDGLCNFCSAQVRFILRIDPVGAIRFTSIQSPYGWYLAEQFGIDPDDPSTFLFFDRGHPLRASDAVIAMLGRLSRPWRWLRILRIVPRPLRDAAYQLIARNRYRLLGRRESCMIPPPHIRARFIDDIPPGDP